MKRLAPLFAFALLAASPATAMADDNRPFPQIRITGEGTATLAPDMAVVTMSVVSEADTAREALSKNNRAMGSVLAAMKAEGIEERDLQTSDFRIDPRYSHSGSSIRSGGSPEIDGFRVFNSLTVRIRDLAKLGTILDKSVTLGINQGGNIAFTNDDPAEALTAARKAAMEDALARARTLTEAAGIGLGQIIEISEQSFQPGPVPIARAQVIAKYTEESVPVAGGENQYRVTVNVAIELDQ